jgi:hypothetical protein
MTERDNWEDLIDVDLVVQKEINLNTYAETTKVPNPSNKVPSPASNHSNEDDWLRTIHPYFGSQPKIILLKREAPARGQQDSKPQPKAPTSQKIQTLEEKEKIYAQARAQIFNQK